MRIRDLRLTELYFGIIRAILARGWRRVVKWQVEDVAVGAEALQLRPCLRTR